MTKFQVLTTLHPNVFQTLREIFNRGIAAWSGIIKAPRQHGESIWDVDFRKEIMVDTMLVE